MRITRKIFSILSCLLQAIANISNVGSLVVCEQIVSKTRHVSGALGIAKLVVTPVMRICTDYDFLSYNIKPPQR